MSKRTTSLPKEVQLGCAEIGASIRQARMARSLKQADLAERLSVSRDLIVRMEKGDPGVGLGFYAAALWSFSLLPQFQGSIAEERDEYGEHLRNQKKARRVRTPNDDDDLSSTMDF